MCDSAPDGRKAEENLIAAAKLLEQRKSQPPPAVMPKLEEQVEQEAVVESVEPIPKPEEEPVSEPDEGPVSEPEEEPVSEPEEESSGEETVSDHVFRSWNFLNHNFARYSV